MSAVANAAAAANLPVEALDRLRTQLGLLTQSIGSLLQELRTADPLPPWPTLTAQLAILNSQLSSLSHSINQHSSALSTTVAYPLPTFPARTQENLLNLLLRKKLAPEVEEWFLAGRDKGAAITAASQSKEDEDGSESENESEGSESDDDDMEDDDGEGKKRNKHWALKAVIKEQRSRDWEADFTKEEVEKVGGDVTKIETGLQVDSEGRIIKKAVDLASQSMNKRAENGLTLEALFRFMSSGTKPGELPAR
ncbi:hypothetical protein ABW19_dt0208919 [Dactylella cylindrospora]|nr:hypothetical protein ABW19_dt0208919 [Dactylella cylindrospora]